MAVIVLNNGLRIKCKLDLKDSYTRDEAELILKHYAPYLAKSRSKSWQNVHDYYCVLLNYILDRSNDLKEFIAGKHLYLMQNQNGLIKIGRSSFVEQRKKQIEVETGFKIIILHIFQNSGKDEIRWHRLFKTSNKRFKNIFGANNREWFSLSATEISTIFNNYPV